MKIIFLVLALFMISHLPVVTAMESIVACIEDSDCTRRYVGCSSNGFCLYPSCTTLEDCAEYDWKLCSSGYCHDCLTNADCTSPEAPFCWTERALCIACLSNAECRVLDGGLHPICSKKGKCVQCETQNDCLEPAKPNCALSANECTNCTSDAHCNHFPTLPHCDSSIGECFACVTSSHCSADPLLSRCNITVHECAVCESNNDCTHFSSMSRTKCKAEYGCVECLENADCSKTEAASYCDLSTNTCKLCNADSDCDHFAPDKPYCVPTVGVGCSKCGDNSHCDYTKAVCSSSTYTCEACSEDTDCDLYADINRPRCFSGVCKQCATATDCDPTTPICNAQGFCQPCTSDSQCLSSAWGLPKCSNGQCYACLTSVDDCTTVAASFCDTSSTFHECKMCTQESECSHLSATLHCKVGTGCVTCNSHAECTYTLPVCSDSTNKCVGCTIDSDCSLYTPQLRTRCFSSQCKQCEADSDCANPTPICNTATGLCRACNNNLDCLNSGWNLPVCSGGSCYECVNSVTDCLTPENSLCTSNTCQIC